jgi:hypothetical protein
VLVAKAKRGRLRAKPGQWKANQGYWVGKHRISAFGRLSSFALLSLDSAQSADFASYTRKMLLPISKKEIVKSAELFNEPLPLPKF